MFWKSDHQQRSSGTWLLVVTVLVIGVTIGAIARPNTWWRALATRPISLTVTEVTRISPSTATPKDDLLETLEIQVDPANWSRLAADAERGIQRRQLTLRDDEEATMVPAQIRWSGQNDWVMAEVRLKGDWIDHLQGAFWSLRIHLPSKHFFHGIQVLSIQVPETRNFLGEWLMNETARSLGILAPRGGFVRTIINGQARGPAYWEEHSAKQFLESQRRREGPILGLNEEPLWKGRLQMGRAWMTSNFFGAQISASGDPVSADPSLIGKFTWRQRPSMAAQVDHGFASLDRLQQAIVAKLRDPKDREAAATWVHQHIDRQITARMMALCSVFGAKHGVTVWHNLRFYHNPINGLLEPVLFDNLPGGPARDEVATEWGGEWPSLLMADPGYQEHFWTELKHLIDDETLNQAIQSHLNSDIAVSYERLMAGTGMATREFWRQAWAERRAHLSALLDPLEPIGLRSVRLSKDSKDPGTISVEVWAHTRRPLAVSWIESSNGTRLNAKEVVEGTVQCLPDGAVLIPEDGTRVTFHISADVRLEGLADTSQMKRQIRSAEAERRSPPLRVRWRLLGDADKTTTIETRNVERNWRETGLPAAPSLQDFLIAHPGWVYDLAAKQLTAPSGTWRIDQDIITPSGISIVIPAGSDWAIAPDILIVVRGPLDLKGTQDHPITLQRLDLTKSWSGLVVLGDQRPSSWSWAVIGGAKAPNRGWWSLTGATTIHHSPITMRDCRFTGSDSEDQVNIIDTSFDFERVSIAKSPSDLLDTDFADGRIVNCDFSDSGEDAIDVSESRVTVEKCRFDRIGDKACSIGEHSRADLTDLTIGSTVIGVASKDRSSVKIQGMRIASARIAGFVTYIKKPEWGPASLEALDVQVGGTPRWNFLCQTGCQMLIDKNPIAAQELDVERLYKEKVLGQ